MTKFQPPRGMKDIEQEEMAKREYVYGKIKQVLKRYGFQLVEPSALEELKTLVAKSGPEIEKEIYAFKDKSGRDIALRFDLTVGLARMVANRQFPRPIKLACISNMWRYDRPQYARYRCFYQWDIEIFGCKNEEADAEIVSVMIDVLEAFGIRDFKIRINNRKLIEGFLAGIGVENKNLLPVLRTVDKFTKLSKAQLEKEFRQYGLTKDQVGRVFQFCKETGEVEKTLENIRQTLPENEMAKQGWKELDSLANSLKTYGKMDRCVIDLSIVRGIDYYTGIVYEAWIKDEGDMGAVAGGGRFDDLVGVYGRQMPATGVAGGIERLLLSLEKLGLLPPDIRFWPTVLVVYVNKKLFSKALEITQTLRNKGISADIDLSKRSLSGQMKYANALNIPIAVIIGEKELRKNMVKIRDMKTGKEQEIGISELPEKLQK
jgi:histidyl-tRNA synthetase